MKKSLLISSLILTVLSFSKIKGNLELDSKVERKEEILKTTILAKTDFKYDNLIFDFQIGVDELDSKDKIKENIMENTELSLKYILPSYMKLNSLVGLKFKSIKDLTLKLDLNYEIIEDLKLGFSIKPNIVYKEIKESSLENKIYLSSKKEEKYNVLGELGIKNTYTKDPFKKVFLNLDGEYKGVKDLTLSGKIRFAHAFNGEKLELEKETELYDEKTILYNKVEDINKYYQSYILGLKYTGIDKLDIEINSYFYNYLKNEKEYKTFPKAKSPEERRQLYKKYIREKKLTEIPQNELFNYERKEYDIYNTYIYYSFNPKISYEVIENLFLISNNKFSGEHKIRKGFSDYNHKYAYIDLNLGTKYIHKFNDKISLTPNFGLTSKFNLEPNTKPLVLFTEKMELGLESNYRPINNLSINPEVNVAYLLKKDNYNEIKHSFDFNANLNIKYSF